MNKRRNNGIVYVCAAILIIGVFFLMIRSIGGEADLIQTPPSIELSIEKKSILAPENIFKTEFSAAHAVPDMNLYNDNDNQIHSDYSDTPDITDNIILEIEKSGNEGIKKLELISGGAQMLIYHTHTTEAYRRINADEYKESSKWRTNNNSKNITAVGEALSLELSSKYGLAVIHDYTNHEPPKLSSSYSRSVITMEKYRNGYPNMQIYIDVHRDAANIETNKDDVVIINGKRCARVMFVVGTGDSVAALEKPNHRSNYKLAEAISSNLNAINPKFTRPIRVKPGRYNQHISDSCLLIEVGHNANTLDEALNSVPYIAKAISDCIKIKT